MLNGVRGAVSEFVIRFGANADLYSKRKPTPGSEPSLSFLWAIGDIRLRGWRDVVEVAECLEGPDFPTGSACRKARLISNFGR